jgi:hypothetical protein
MTSDPVEQAAGEELEPTAPRTGRRTAAEKIYDTLREMSMPAAGADEVQLALSTVAMGLERSFGPMITEAQESGELDEFVLALTRWAATHRSDGAWGLLVVEVPRGRVPNGKLLQLVNDAAAAAAAGASSPL